MNAVVHFEIYARDAEKLAKFYSSLFDWTIEAMPGMDYHYVKTTDTDAKGMPTQPGASMAGWSYARPVMKIRVDQLRQRRLARPGRQTRAGSGRKVMKPRAPVPGMGWFAMLVDPQGNTSRCGRGIQTRSNKKGKGKWRGVGEGHVVSDVCS